MGVPWNYGPTEFEVPANRASVVELRVPHRGTIRRLIVDEQDVTGAATFQIFSSEETAYAVADAVAASSSSESSSGSSESVSGSSESSSSSSSESAAAAAQRSAAHSIMGVKTVAAGRFADYAMNIAYRNSDGTSTNPVRRLWMVITPEGSGNKSYTVAMTIEMPDLMS